MRHSTLCGGEIRLEFFANKGLACADVIVDGDFEDRPPAHCDYEKMRGVLNGEKQHLAGPGWLCTLERTDGSIAIDLWRDGRPPKRCKIPIGEYESALELAFGSGSRAYAA
jgi:hypothetical protein